VPVPLHRWRLWWRRFNQAMARACRRPRPRRRRHGARHHPPTCIGCGGATGEPHTLCARCWSEIQFIERPYCERLGTPFAVDLGMALLFAGRDRRSAGVWAGPRRGAL